MQRSLAFLALSLAAPAACARPLPPDPSPAPAERIVGVDADGSNIRSTNSTGAVAAELAITPAAAYRALVNVYTQLGLAPEIIDDAALRVARTNLPVRRLLAGERVSVYFDCGQTLTGPRSEQGRLTVNIASQATAGASGAVVATVVSAVVRPTDGTSTSATNCSSTGLLEKRIHDAVKRGA